ncbi:MAG TPA: hypothetical protein ENI76_08405 [Ignavibacteria bacterium]|nr:hypothetical protein [Ignavibacteria bacterium]
MKIVKASGDVVPFDKNAIKKSIVRAGASSELAKEVSNEVRKKVSDGMNTKDILKLTLKSLKKNPKIATRYDLKRAIMKLGPTGFPFEEFFSQVLKSYGYKTRVGVQVMGKVVSQEVDIIAIKKLTSMVEAKYHNAPGIKTDKKVAMYTYARYLDIKSNPKNHFDNAWLVTNTKCTSQAIKYSKGVGIKMVGWSYPSKGNLQELIEKRGLYPITIFKNMPNKVKEKLFEIKIVLAKDLVNRSLGDLVKKTGLNKKVLSKVLDEAKNYVSGNNKI